MRDTLSLLKLLCAATLIGVAPAALAQKLPAGMGGYWKITKMHPKKPLTTASCTTNPSFFSKTARGSRVLMSDQKIVWGSSTATSPAPRVSMMEPADFSAHHSQAGVTLHELSLDHGSKVEVLKLGAPGTLPFDTIVVLDPSTVYFERCGIFMEAVHDSGFVAPPLPNQQQ